MALLLAAILATGGPAGAQTSVQTCANCDTRGVSAPPDCDKRDGENDFSAYSGNVHRAVTDMTVFGSVGKMPLKFMRYSNKRMSPQNASQGRFGREGVWTHNYQCFLRQVTDPSGRFLKFTYLNLGRFAQEEVRLGSVSAA